MADATAAPNMASPFNALIAQNQQPAQNPLTQIGQIAQTQGAFANAQRAGSEADDAALANAQNHTNFRIQAMGPYVAMGDQVTTNSIAKGLQDLVESSKGAFSAQEAAHTLGNIPTSPGGDANAPNPAAAQWLRTQQLRLLGMQQQIQTMRGDTVSTNTGGQTQFGTRNAFTGNYTPQGGADGSLTNTMSPAEAATPTTGPVNKLTGTQTSQTLGERAEQAGLAQPGTYTGQGGGGSGPTRVFIGADGRISKPMQGGGAMMAPAASGPIQTSLSPAQTAVNKASGDAYATAQSNMATYAQREQQLQSGLTALQGTNTGPGTESRNAIESYMLGLPGGLGRWIPGVDPKSVAAFDTANKYLTAAAASNPSAGRSDAGLSTAIASNPSVHISNQAAQDIQKANLGFVRFEKANMQSFGGQDASQWQAHIAQRNTSIDPHAYSADLITPAQRSAYMASLSPSGKTKYFASIRDAMANGAFSPADLQQGAAGGR